MLAIGLLADETQDRQTIDLILGELGHQTSIANRLDEVLEFARAKAPQVFLVVDSQLSDAEKVTRELVRAFPFVPILVAQKNRNAKRAVELMRVGAFDVIAPPWTRTDIKASLNKSQRWQGTLVTPVLIAPRKRSPIWYGLAIGLFLSIALGVASLRRSAQLRALAAARVDRWELTIYHPAGLSFDGKNLWAIDWYTQALYALTLNDARVVALRHLTSETPVAATFTSDAIWTAMAEGSVVRRMRDEKLTTLARYPQAAPNCAGIAIDGLYAWTLDSSNRVLTKRLLDESLTPVHSWEITGLKPSALVWDGKALWSLDAVDRVLRRHDLENPSKIIAVLPLPEYAEGNYIPTGLAWDGDRFWTVAEEKEGKAPALLARHRAETTP